MAKTWEMIRDIKPGETWEITQTIASNWVGVRVRTLGEHGNIEFVTAPRTNNPDHHVGNSIRTCGAFVQAEWRKVPVLVTFTKAWEAFEEGKVIRSAINNHHFRHDPNINIDFNSDEIRGMWEIIE